MADRVPRNLQRQSFDASQRIVLVEQDVDMLLDLIERQQSSIGKLLATAVTLLLSVLASLIVLVTTVVAGR